jgi:diguanylate cyclase (GGDEF)-like protein
VVIDGRRRVLGSLLGVLVVVYAAAVCVSWWDTAGAVGELWAAAIAAVGVVMLAPRRVGVVRHGIAVVCAAVAPPVSMLFHVQLAGQVWALIPAMFLALYLRAVYRPVLARVLCAGVAVVSTTALLISPAPAPMLWPALWVVCILGAAELFGALGAELISGALRDPLTSVWNRAGAGYAADRLIAHAARRSQNVAVIVFDVDDFKGINDRHGHLAGDRILADLTDAWTAKAPAGSVIARVGGDEFVVIVAGYDRIQGEELAAALMDGLAIGVTSGVAVGPPTENAVAALFAEADTAMYQKKSPARRR